MVNNAEDAGRDRRTFLKAALYVAPVVMTLKAKTAHASLGSSRPPVKPTEPQRGPAASVQVKDEWNGGGYRGRGR